MIVVPQKKTLFEFSNGAWCDCHAKIMQRTIVLKLKANRKEMCGGSESTISVHMVRLYFESTYYCFFKGAKCAPARRLFHPSTYVYTKSPRLLIHLIMWWMIVVDD